jgi:hypothetical protein
MIIEKSTQFCVRQSRPVSSSSVPARSLRSVSPRALREAETDSFQPVGDVIGGILRSIVQANEKTATR